MQERLPTPEKNLSTPGKQPLFFAIFLQSPFRYNSATAAAVMEQPQVELTNLVDAGLER